MNPAEYERMSTLEDAHWWYVGARDLMSRVFETQRAQLGTGGRVLDAGCGTGANLRWLHAQLAPAYLGGFDISATAVDHARRKNPTADVYVSDLCTPEIHNLQLDAILCCDVLYTTPLAAGIAGLKSICNRLRPGGVLLLHLPALNWLRSHHDAAVHTQQRFDLASTRQVLTDCGLKLEFLTYRMFLLFPALLCRRLPSILFRSRRPSADSDLSFPGELMNRALVTILCWENWLIMQGVRFPWGSSILAMGRKL